MNCAYCPIQDLCLEFYYKVLIAHDYVEKANCPLEYLALEYLAKEGKDE